MLLLLGLISASAVASTPQLSCSPSNLGFGNVEVGQTETLTFTVTNGGTAIVTVSKITVSDSAFTTSQVSLPLVLSTGQSVPMSVTFTPTTKGWTGGTVKFSSDASNATLALKIGGTGVTSEAASASPSNLAFGQVAVGSSASQPLVLTNNRSWNLTISAVQANSSAFSIGGATFPLTLGAGQSVALTVKYTPQSAGTSGGSVSVSGAGLSIPLTGTGTVQTVGQLSVGPSPLNYGNVTVGATDTLPITMSAAGGSVTVSSATSSSSQFVLNGASFPLTIAPGQSVSFNVAFTPSSSGTMSGSLSFASNASNSPATESLTGVGTAASYTINLSWNQSSDVAGYNVYRSTSSNGTFSKINSAMDANTAYTDSSVMSGNTYYYAATSVTSGGQESSLSTPVQAVVP